MVLYRLQSVVVKQEKMSYRIVIDEAERQAVLMALAHLAIERPGWNDMLSRIAMKMDEIDTIGDTGQAGPKTYTQFKQLAEEKL
jgi:hypothetical protein